MSEYPFVPGKGMVTKAATEERLSHLKELGIETDELSQTSLSIEDIDHNIESLIGSVEIPVGLAGPLLMNNQSDSEWVYMAAGTLEGTLLASMNRGARAISLSGGFSTAMIHQKMIRSPMFVFETIHDAVKFKKWVDEQFEHLKKISEEYSNHAELIQVDSVIASRSVQVRFVYKTGDAAGQNMTTSCTWHAVLWMKEAFYSVSQISPTYFNIEGNGASDKKISNYSIRQGRGIHVIAECHLQEKHIKQVLRTTSDHFIRCYHSSLTLASMDGMVGYNINVANAVAAAFVSTGQDLGSIHESSIGILNLEKSDTGLYLSLHLPNLVIGTVGGGTHLQKQRQALEISKCYGNNKVERFASIIAGFALSLEISTFAAIVGGQFAASHERMGRNKPINWLTRSEIDLEFIKKGLSKSLKVDDLLDFNYNKEKFYGDGILMNLSRQVVKKQIGFMVLGLEWGELNKIDKSYPDFVLVKSKPIDKEAIRGLHLLASAVDVPLSRLINEYGESLEYKDAHLKELLLFEEIAKQGFDITPKYYGKIIDEERQIYMLFQEFIEKTDVLNTQDTKVNQYDVWNKSSILNTIDTIHDFHTTFVIPEHSIFVSFDIKNAKELYKRFVDLTIDHFKGTAKESEILPIINFIQELQEGREHVKFIKSIIHNDFNTRNMVIRKDGRICIYDWELATINYPARDIMEFLSFVFPVDFKEEEFKSILIYYMKKWDDAFKIEKWKSSLIFVTKEYIITRVLYYVVGKMVVNFSFADRVFFNSLRFIRIIEDWK